MCVSVWTSIHTTQDCYTEKIIPCPCSPSKTPTAADCNFGVSAPALRRNCSRNRQHVSEWEGWLPLMLSLTIFIAFHWEWKEFGLYSILPQDGISWGKTNHRSSFVWVWPWLFVPYLASKRGVLLWYILDSHKKSKIGCCFLKMLLTCRGKGVFLV